MNKNSEVTCVNTPSLVDSQIGIHFFLKKRKKFLKTDNIYNFLTVFLQFTCFLNENNKAEIFKEQTVANHTKSANVRKEENKKSEKIDYSDDKGNSAKNKKRRRAKITTTFLSLVILGYHLLSSKIIAKAGKVVIQNFKISVYIQAAGVSSQKF